MNVSVVEAQSPFDEGVTFLAKLSKPMRCVRNRFLGKLSSTKVLFYKYVQKDL